MMTELRSGEDPVFNQLDVFFGRVDVVTAAAPSASTPEQRLREFDGTTRAQTCRILRLARKFNSQRRANVGRIRREFNDERPVHRWLAEFPSGPSQSRREEQSHG